MLSVAGGMAQDYDSHRDMNARIPADIQALFDTLNPFLPQCIGEPDCTAEITGQLPVDFIPPLTNKYPLVQTFRVVNPSNYARTVFIEALEKAGVKVDAQLTAENPVQLLPPKDSYSHKSKMAELQGQPYSVMRNSY